MREYKPIFQGEYLLNQNKTKRQYRIWNMHFKTWITQTTSNIDRSIDQMCTK